MPVKIRFYLEPVSGLARIYGQGMDEGRVKDYWTALIEHPLRRRGFSVAAVVAKLEFNGS